MVAEFNPTALQISDDRLAMRDALAESVNDGEKLAHAAGSSLANTCGRRQRRRTIRWRGS